MVGPRVGVDIVAMSRVRNMLEARRDALMARLLTPDEAAYCKGPKEAERVSGRLAAKEAVMKVLGDGWPSIPWTSVEVLPGALGRPEVRLTGKAQMRFSELGLLALDLSITHDGGFAVAVAIALAGKERGDDDVASECQRDEGS